MNRFGNDEQDDFEHRQEISLATCKRCGEEGLHWEETDDGWRLFDAEGDRHVCRDDRVVGDVMDDFR